MQERWPAARAARRAVSRASYEAKSVVARYPALALPAGRLRGHGVILDAKTEVVIEGYPRSANSFSVAAFELAQGRKVRIAHHLHAPAHLLAAIRVGVPALALIRAPEDAVLEFVIVRPDLSIGQALRGYVRFYEPLLPHRDRLTVGRFEEVTVDFGAVVRRLNERDGTAFKEFEHTAENARICFDAMDRYWRDRVGEGSMLERRVGRPSEVRDAMKERLLEAYRSGRLAAPRARAEGLHRAFGRPEAA